jgi:hypothetical protein
MDLIQCLCLALVMLSHLCLHHMQDDELKIDGARSLVHDVLLFLEGNLECRQTIADHRDALVSQLKQALSCKDGVAHVLSTTDAFLPGLQSMGQITSF